MNTITERAHREIMRVLTREKCNPSFEVTKSDETIRKILNDAFPEPAGEWVESMLDDLCQWGLGGKGSEWPRREMGKIIRQHAPPCSEWREIELAEKDPKIEYVVLLKTGRATKAYWDDGYNLWNCQFMSKEAFEINQPTHFILPPQPPTKG